MRENRRGIIQKIMRRMLCVYLCILLLTVLLICTVFIPSVFAQGMERAEYRLSYIISEYESMIERAENSMTALISMPEFSRILGNYNEERTEASLARLVLYLSQLRNFDSNILFLMIEDAEQNAVGSIYYGREQLCAFITADENYQRLRSVSTRYRSPIYEDAIDDHALCFCAQVFRIDNRDYIITICYNADMFIYNIDMTWSDGLDIFRIENLQGEYVFGRARRGMAEETQVHTGGRFSLDMALKTGGRIAGATSAATLLANHTAFLAVSLGLIVLPPIILYVFMYSTARRNLRSICQLCGEIKDFRIGDEPPPVIRSGDEVEDLSEVFHNMAIKINLQAQGLIERERENALTSYKLFVTQLDPHFVSNTMNIINIMARNGRTQDILAVNNALIRMLRDRLNVNTSPYATVRGEVQMLRQYVLIVEYKYGAHIDITYEINHLVEDAPIPKGILQLLVENALVHGLMGAEDDALHGSISVAIYSEADERLVIEVNDDGRGIDAERLEYMRAHKFDISTAKEDSHIGLNNIYKRLEYLYPGNFQMDIFSHKGDGTSVVISIPYAR